MPSFFGYMVYSLPDLASDSCADSLAIFDVEEENRHGCGRSCVLSFWRVNCRHPDWILERYGVHRAPRLKWVVGQADFNIFVDCGGITLPWRWFYEHNYDGRTRCRCGIVPS